LRADAELPRLEKLIEIKAALKDEHKLNSLLRKRMREQKKHYLNTDEEAKKSKNFGIEMVKSLDQKDQERV